MEKLKEKFKYSKKGITLISLVVTIVVLLILAGISIATLTGNNGLITKTSQSKTKMEEAEEKERVELAVTSSKMEDISTLIITQENLEKALKQEFGNNVNFTITDNGDNSFTIKFNVTNRMYYVTSSGEIIENSNTLQISNVNEFKNFRDEVNTGNTFKGMYIYLANDINLENEEWAPIGYYSDENNNISFDGIFDGQYHNITININNENGDYQGLFAYNCGTIKNIVISENSNIKANWNVGTIVALNIGTVQNCINNANVECTNNNIGGIVGKNNGNVINCQNSGTIINSANTTGGIVGWNMTDGIVERCINMGTVITQGDTVGGITGSNDGKLIECCNNNTIYGVTHIGGICGRNNDGLIQFCYNTKNISSEKSNSGGIVGYSNPNSSVYDCYNIGEITGNGTTGGIGGWISGKISNCHYLENTANYACNNSGNVDGISSQTQNYMLSDNFILDLNKNSKIYKIDTEKNDGYPILIWQ